MRKSFCAALLIAFAFLICPFYAFAQAAEPESDVSATPARAPFSASPTSASFTTVMCEDELLDWLYGHESTSGTVTLGGNITITGEYEDYFPFIFPSVGVSIVIDTGPFGLTFDGGCIVGDAYYGGSLEFRGEGVSYPVVDVIDMGWFRMGSWSNYMQSQFITAYGKDGAGGTALKLSGEDYSITEIGMLQAEGRVRSEGAGAVGIDLAVPANLYGFNVSASGENSVAVKSANSATLYFCKLSAGGGGQCVTGDVTLDTCAAEPTPESAAVINRRLKRFRICLPRGWPFAVWCAPSRCPWAFCRR